MLCGIVVYGIANIPHLDFVLDCQCSCFIKAIHKSKLIPGKWIEQNSYNKY